MKVRAYFHNGLVGCDVEEILEIPEDELEGLSASEREEHIEEYVNDWKSNFVDWGWEEINGPEEREQ